jgi:hypothetical protein
MSLADWLLERIAEDEVIAKKAAEAKRAEYSHGGAGVSWVSEDGMVHRADIDREVDESGLWDSEGMTWRLVPEQAIADQFARHDPARVLAECDAKRRIVALHTWSGDPARVLAECEAKRRSGLVYADCPRCDELIPWRPSPSPRPAIRRPGRLPARVAGVARRVSPGPCHGSVKRKPAPHG